MLEIDVLLLALPLRRYEYPGMAIITTHYVQLDQRTHTSRAAAH